DRDRGGRGEHQERVAAAAEQRHRAGRHQQRGLDGMRVSRRRGERRHPDQHHERDVDELRAPVQPAPDHQPLTVARAASACRYASRRRSTVAAIASATAQYPAKSASPGPGARLCAPWVSEKIDRPAASGRYGAIALFQLVGRMLRSGGITKKIAAKAAIAPAVLRTMVPIATVS